MQVFSFYDIQNHAAVKKTTFSEIYDIFVSFLSINAKQIFKTGVAAAVFICFLALFNSIFAYQNSSIRRISFVNQKETDLQFLDTAMKNFIAPKQPDDFDESGNVSSLNAKQVSFTLPVSFSTYTVKSNDTISGITKAVGLKNISTLIAVNNIQNVRSLRSGQKLKIPSIDGLTHTVQKNESLAKIASFYNVTVENLLDVNDLSSTTIKSGETLFIPNARLNDIALKKALGEFFIMPLINWRLTSAYGFRSDPFTGVTSFHTGIDMAAPTGTPIKNALEGKIIAVGYNNTYGNYVILSHAGGYQTLYGHMSAIYAKAGQQATQGTILGLVGNTGYSTGPHLHFTVYQNGKTVNPFTLLK